MAFFQFKTQMQFNNSLEEIWEFISDPKNLQEITPEYMQFRILNDPLPEKMYPGMIIKYSVKPIFKIPTTWVTEITQVRDKEYFVDEQRVGPYTMWHHQHILQKRKDGVLMNDIVSYKPPFGIIGALSQKLFIRSKIEEIFEFRNMAFAKRFNVVA